MMFFGDAVMVLDFLLVFCTPTGKVRLGPLSGLVDEVEKAEK